LYAGLNCILSAGFPVQIIHHITSYLSQLSAVSHLLLLALSWSWLYYHSFKLHFIQNHFITVNSCNLFTATRDKYM